MDPIIIPPENRVYAIGDIHGQSAYLRGLLGLIEKDLYEQPLKNGQKYTLAFLGDFVDGGLDSKGVLDTVTILHKQDSGHVFLNGRGHDDYVLKAIRQLQNCEALTDEEIEKITDSEWRTLCSYEAKIDTKRGWKRSVRELLLPAIPDEHIAFLANLQQHARFGRYLLIHDPFEACGKPDTERSREEFYEMDVYLTNPNNLINPVTITADHPLRKQIIVHGHWHDGRSLPPELHDHRIGVCNCDFNYINAVALESNRPPRFFSYPPAKSAL